MSNNQVKAIVDLFRITLGFLSGFAVLSAGFIVYVLKGNSPDFASFFMSNGVLEWPGIVLGLFATMLLTWCNQAINDYFDIETDIANKRFDRPLARGDLSRSFVRNLTIAMYISAACIILYLVLVYNVTIALFLLTLIFILIGVTYNLGIKQLGFLGNVWVASGYIAPLFVGFFLLNPSDEKIILTCILILNSTFFLALGREIIKDIQDYEGDKQQNLNSLAIKIGPRKAGMVAVFLFLVTFGSSVIVGLFVYQNLVFWVFDGFFLAILILTGYTILTEQTQGGKKARKYTRWSLWVALGAFFFGIYYIP
ncbi:MAG: UbiA family prenyltransferase [Candidatus Hodarchaeales archaeon]